MPSPHISTQAVLVLGMHRSGTSLLMRICNLLGVDLAEDLLPAREDNAKGFFEHREIVEINEAIFRCFSLSSQDVIALPERWWEHPAIAPLRQVLHECITQNFAGRPLWGIKDPRIAKLLPLWLPLLAELGVTPRCFIPFRHPLEVAASLHKRDALSIERGIVLWLQYNLAIEKETRGYERHFVHYPDMMAYTVPAAQRVADVLGKELDAKTEAAIGEFIDPSLRHHHGADWNKPLPEFVQALYTHMVDISQGREIDEALFDSARNTLDILSSPLQETITGMKPELYIWRNLPDVQAKEKAYFKQRAEELERILTHKEAEAKQLPFFMRLLRRLKHYAEIRV